MECIQISIFNAAQIKLFKDNGQYKDDVFVAVNGRAFQIMRGVEVEVPLCAAEVLENARMMESTARSYVDRMAN